MIDVEKIKSVYFIGIGGIAMSAVSAIAKQKDFEVFGSDSKEAYSPSLDVLKKYGIECFKGYDKKNVENSKSDLFIVSAGEDMDNPEVKFVYDKKLPHVGFPEFLYELSKNKLRVVVTGTHGKSTTAAILGRLLKNIDDSSFLIGGVLQQEGSNFHLGEGHYFVFEGDEYKSEFDDPTPKFQYYRPDILVLTNLEYDHPDLFRSFEDLEREFEYLIANLPDDGLLIYNADDINLTRLADNTEVSKVSFSIENEADYKATSIKYNGDYTTINIENGFSSSPFSSPLMGEGREGVIIPEQYKTQLPGKLYAYDALAAIASLRALEFPQEQILLNLLSFKGLKRRFEVLGKKNGITIIDDYAHHPTAVKATLEAAKIKYPDSKIWCVFEPHTFSRTQATLSDLAKAFSAADEVLISEIYPAREKSKDFNITSQMVVKAIFSSSSPGEEKMSEGQMRSKSNVRLVNNKQQALTILKNELKPGDVIIVMAVGDFNKLGYELRQVL